MTLHDALQAAVAAHPSVISKRSEFDAAQSGLDAAEWQRYPAVSGQSTNNPLRDGAVTMLRLEQPLWTGGRISATIDASKAKLSAADAGVIEAEQKILSRTAAVFVELVRLGSRIEAAEENIAEHERLLGLIQRRAQQGVASPSEVITARARMQQARSEHLQLKTAATNAKADLEQIISAAAPEIRVPKADLTPPADLDLTVQAALEYSPQMRRLAADTSSASAEIEVRKAALYPALSVRHERYWAQQYPDSTTYLAVTFQPGNGLAGLASVREAEARRTAAAENEASIRKDVSDAVRNDWNKVQSARDEVAVLRELVSATRDMYESFVRQYAAGKKSWLEVLNARRESIQARNSLTDTEWGGVLAALRLRISTGEISAQNLAMSNRLAFVGDEPARSTAKGIMSLLPQTGSTQQKAPIAPAGEQSDDSLTLTVLNMRQDLGSFRATAPAAPASAGDPAQSGEGPTSGTPHADEPPGTQDALPMAQADSEHRAEADESGDQAETAAAPIAATDTVAATAASEQPVDGRSQADTEESGSQAEPVDGPIAEEDAPAEIIAGEQQTAEESPAVTAEAGSRAEPVDGPIAEEDTPTETIAGEQGDLAGNAAEVQPFPLATGTQGPANDTDGEDATVTNDVVTTDIVTNEPGTETTAGVDRTAALVPAAGARQAEESIKLIDLNNTARLWLPKHVARS